MVINYLLNLSFCAIHTWPEDRKKILLPLISFYQVPNITKIIFEFLPKKFFFSERWIPDERNPDWNHKPEIVIPFGSGKRICPGKRLAEQEIYILTAKIFKNFRLSPLGPFEVEFNWLLSPAGPLEFKIDLV